MGVDTEPTKPGSASWRALGSRSRWIVVVAVGLTVLYFGPLLITHPAQDACSFGPVSNERYRQLLAEAERKQAAEWPPLVWDNKRNMALLNERFDDLSRGMTSVYERLAAMHAVVRALGGNYRRTQSDQDNPYAGNNRYGLISFHYHVDVNRLHFFSPLRRNMWLISTLLIVDNVPSYVIQDRYRSHRGDIEFIVWLPTLFDSYITIPASNFGACPRVPEAELAGQLNRSEK